MKNNHKKILLLILAMSLIVFGYSQSQSEWELKSDEDDIYAYTRNIENTKILEYRIEAKIEGSVPAAVNLMRNLDLYEKLFPDTKDHKIIHQESENEFHMYLTIDTPFPAKDRDGTYHNIITINPEYSKARIEIKISDKGDHIKTNKIRLKDCYGFWEFTKISNNKIGIVHQFYADPEGVVPKWLINKMIVNNPIKSLQNMKKLILKYGSKNPAQLKID